MAIVRNSIFAPMQDAPTRKAASSLRLAPVKNDVFLNALLETPMAKQERRSPLQWVGAMGLHITRQCQQGEAGWQRHGPRPDYGLQ